MRLIAAYLIGLIFGLGITVSGMVNPAKILNFFDIAGSWDPSLIFVMVSALIVTFAGYGLVLKRRTPVIDKQFVLPQKRSINARLIAGSILFGIGWGITGFCPGGALPALVTGRNEVVLFIIALSAGILAAQAAIRFLHKSEAGSQQSKA